MSDTTQTLNTLEFMVQTALELCAQDRWHGSPATETARITLHSILSGMPDEDLKDLRSNLEIRRKWCAHMLTHEARSIVEAETKAVQAWRAGMRTATTLQRHGAQEKQ